MTYADVALKLDVSETTVKRMFSGKVPMTLDRIDGICALLGTDVIELARRSAELSGAQGLNLSLEQEGALVADIKLYIMFYALLKGIPFDKVVAKYRYDPGEGEKKLLALDKLGLIELHPGNAVKVLAPRHIEWIEGGPLEKMYESQMQIDFLSADFSGEFDLLKRLAGPLSAQSVTYLHKKLEQLMADVKEFSFIDGSSGGDAPKPIYTLLVGFREWIPSIITQQLRGEGQ